MNPARELAHVATTFWAALKLLLKQSLLTLLGLIVLCAALIAVFVLPGMDGLERLLGLAMVLLLFAFVVQRASDIVRHSPPALILGEKALLQYLLAEFGTRERPMRAGMIESVHGVAAPNNAIGLPEPAQSQFQEEA